MNRMLALLLDNYKPDYILRGLFLWRLPIDVWSHLLREKVSDPQALALKAIPSRSQPSKASLAKRSPTPAQSSRSPMPPGACWFHKKHGDKAVNCRKPCGVRKIVVQQVEVPVQPASPVPAPAPAPAPVLGEVCCSSLLFLRNILSDREFLVDSGTSVSVFPGPKSTSVDGVCLLTADGSLMVCSGSHIIPWRFSCGSNSKVYSWNFQLAQVSAPLLGADFLQHFNLLVYIKCRWVVHADCREFVIPRASPGPVPAFCTVAFLSAPHCIKKLLEDFPDVLSSDGFTASKPCYRVWHHLLTNPGPPVFAKP